MQYRSLAELQNKTKGAFKENLRQGLTYVEQRMKKRLEDFAAQTLDPIGRMELGSPQIEEEFKKYFADVKRSHPEVEEIFVFGYWGEQLKPISFAYIYSDKFVKIPQSGFALPQPHILSQFNKSRMAQSFVDADRKYLFTHHSCPTCPPSMRQGGYLFYPLGDSRQGQSQFAGVLLNEGFVRDGVIARSVSEILGQFHPSDSDPPDLAFTVSDENSQVLYSHAATQNGYFFESNFDRPFSNWRAQVGLKNTNLDELAHDSFMHSAGATVFVLILLLCGMALTIRATDREARLAQAKSTFVANVSHELKTPLSLISLFSEILELGRVNNEEKRTEYYRIIRHESLRLNKTVDNILDFSRIEAGRKTYQLFAGDIAEVIEHVLSTYRYQIISSGFDIQTDIQPDLPPVLIDHDAMAQAISNLLDNAIKYSGKVKQISITAKRLESDVCIEIADHGIGIPRAEQAKVFDKFYRVGNGLVHDVKGSGLGLSLVKHIIEAHNGTISVESDVGKGSRFTILLPLAQTAANA